MNTRPAAPYTYGQGTKKQVFTWSLWDWGEGVTNAIMLTFVFTVYLTSSAFGDPDANASSLALAVALTGAVIALTAPVLGQRADRSGKRKHWLGFHTAVIVLATAACFFIKPDPAYLWPGIFLICVATFFSEIASVNYYAILPQIAPKEKIGRISGIGWAFGYLGGIVSLAVVLFVFVQPATPWFGSNPDEGFNIRLVAVFCAVWMAVFCAPMFFTIPEIPATPGPKTSWRESYVLLWRSIKGLWHRDRPTLWFLLASAVYRDGLATVFTFGGIIAGTVFGMSTAEVIMFALVGNMVAAAGAFIGGWLDDVVGPRAVIMTALFGLIGAGLGVLFAQHSWQFWIFGLVLCLLVGPAQSSSRALLARRTTEHTAGELFGLYATTGRAVTFLGPALFGLSSFVASNIMDSTGVTGSATRYGIVGILVFFVVGIVLFSLVPGIKREDTTVHEDATARVAK